MSKFDVNERVMQYLEKKRISIYKFSKDMDYKSTSTAYGIRDNKQEFKEKNLKRLFKAYPTLNPDWIIEGKGEMEIFKKDQITQSVNISTNMSLRDELAFKEKAELTNLYWSNSAFQRNIKKICDDMGIPEVEVLSEMAYTNADVIISIRSKSQKNHE